MKSKFYLDNGFKMWYNKLKLKIKQEIGGNEYV